MASLSSEIRHHTQGLQGPPNWCLCHLYNSSLSNSISSSHQIIHSNILKLIEHTQRHTEISIAFNLAFGIYNLSFLQLNNQLSATLQVSMATYPKLQGLPMSLI